MTGLLRHSTPYWTLYNTPSASSGPFHNPSHPYHMSHSVPQHQAELSFNADTLLPSHRGTFNQHNYSLITDGNLMSPPATRSSGQRHKVPCSPARKAAGYQTAVHTGHHSRGNQAADSRHRQGHQNTSQAGRPWQHVHRSRKEALQLHDPEYGVTDTVDPVQRGMS